MCIYLITALRLLPLVRAPIAVILVIASITYYKFIIIFLSYAATNWEIAIDFDIAEAEKWARKKARMRKSRRRRDVGLVFSSLVLEPIGKELGNPRNLHFPARSVVVPSLTDSRIPQFFRSVS